MQQQTVKTFFDDEHYQDSLVWQVCNSSAALTTCAPLLEAHDFKPQRGMKRGRPRWFVAGRALDYFAKYGKPIRKHLLADVLEYGVRELGLSERQLDELKEYVKYLDGLKPAAREAVVEKVVRFKQQKLQASLIDQMVELQASGKLTPEDFTKFAERAIARVPQAESAEPPKCTWPAPLGPVARRGLLGEFLDLVEPHTEADPAALLIQTLVAVGNVIGRKPYFEVEASRHHLNLFAAVVGKTSKGRKGTSWDHVKLLLTESDNQWVANRLPSGLASGEGLIYKVRDPILKIKGTRSKKKSEPGEDAIELADEGVDDKRLMVVEPEFTRVLQVCERDTNTLSAILRQAWDTGTLETATRNQPLSAHEAHISVIGHITEDELRRRLTDTAKANGFANRFLWVCADRSKILSRGGNLQPGKLEKLQSRIDDVVSFAKGVGRMSRSDKAWKLWDKVYPVLSGDRPGMAGIVTARAEAQVTRLACLYALMDRKKEVLIQHLQAALEVWRYCEESARYIFGDAIGNPVADAILKKLRQMPQGLTRTEIRMLFQRNKSTAEIEPALNELVKYGLVCVAKEKVEPGQKRPTERWTINGVKGVRA